jgi:hypothetical protein
MVILISYEAIMDALGQHQSWEYSRILPRLSGLGRFCLEFLTSPCVERLSASGVSASFQPLASSFLFFCNTRVSLSFADIVTRHSCSDFPITQGHFIMAEQNQQQPDAAVVGRALMDIAQGITVLAHQVSPELVGAHIQHRSW